MSKYNFKASLAKGQAGEKILLELWPELVRLAGTAADFVLPGGEAVECKADQYPMATTANMFIERYSDVQRGKVGGPWQSWGRGCQYFVYLYAADRTAFVFNVPDLIAYMEQQEKLGALKPVEIRNTRHTTIGYKVPRAALEHLVLKVLKG